MTGPDDADTMVARVVGPECRVVVSRLLSLMVPGAAMLWLEGSNSFFWRGVLD
jgi:hypothetical protein